uniref:Uncharacterized protein n=1 Tax=Rhizophagus irregularis (strain DAOM 181602 / DAOM 197198 / MUCL 43194) TaxID=747089 RepID=U9TML1_RHIID
MNCWLHLPLSVCHLGRFYGHEFAKAYANVVLENDIEEGITNDFGLSDVLKI